jgi:hypothetical protein
MRLYAVYERRVVEKTKGRVRSTPEDSYVLVKEGFCWPALFFGPLWAIANGMWVIFLLLIAVFAAIAFTPELLGSDEVATWLCCGALLILGLFGNDLRQWSLQRAGYELVSIVSGSDLIDAERRLFTSMNSMYG